MPKFCKFTMQGSLEPTVFVNPANVVAVYRNGTETLILTNAASVPGPHTIYVAEPLQTVVRMLEETAA